MRHCFLFRLSLVMVACGLIASSVVANGQDDSNKRGRKYKMPPATAKIEVTVLRDVNGKPIENAAVIFRALVGDTANMELKTNEDGKTLIDVMPIGDKVRLQIIARGFQTFGEDFKIDKPEMAIEIRMKRPGEQYSIYKDHSADVEQSAASDKTAAGAKDAVPATDKPADTAKPKDAPAGPSQPK